MIIDMHTHTGNRKIRMTLDDIGASMKRYGITKSVVFPMRQPIPNGVLNDSLKNLKSGDRRFYFFLRFNPKLTKLKELEQISGGFSGFKLHPRLENFDPLDKRFRSIFKHIEGQEKPVLIHSRKENNKYSDPDRIIILASMYPGIKFVFGHFANDSDPFFDKALKYDNVFVETSIVSSPMLIELRVNQIGSDRILFGSDFPFSDQEIELMKIRKSGLREKDKRRILCENAIRFLKRASKPI